MATESVTIQSASTTTDRYGDTVLDWTDPTETVVAGCRFAPASTFEDLDGRSATVQAVTILMPSGTTVAATDRLVARGVTYEVDGKPADWRGTRVGGVAVQVKEVAG